ncbi:MAG: NAD(P)-dependent oxidoreductase, partial [Alphaproteobacteria bacterium]|nr:NAD(P)-dependent oxidoreductase [Alphaproteobacteria bacterium]
MEFLPIFLRLKDKPCLVVGGGPVAAGKVDVLLKAGAQVHVVAPMLDERLEALATTGQLTVMRGVFEPDHMDGDYRLAIAATNDSAVNAHVVEMAEAHNILANATSDAGAGHFIMPAIIDRSPVIAAVSTGGASPVLARFVRGRLESLIPRAFGDLAVLAKEFREAVKSRLASSAARRAFWDTTFSGPIAELVFNGRLQAARNALQTALNEPNAPQGEVYLVGAGPGDPELLSFRAMRLMQQADVVVYDRLVSPSIMELVRRDA